MKAMSATCYILMLCILGLSLSGCINHKYRQAKEKKAETEAAQSKAQIPYNEDALYPREPHGIMNIHRHGPGYNIQLSLDAGDADVSFEMDLPGSAETEIEGFNPGLADDLPTGEEVNEDQSQIEGDVQLNAKTLNIFYQSTKHIMNAQSLFYKKQYWRALEEANKALNLTPNSAQTYALKGSIYFKMGLMKEAKNAWNRALKLDPSMDDVRQSLLRVERS